MGTRAAVYGRESQGKAASIADQVTLANEAAHEHGWTVVGEYDDGQSASRFARNGRPGWERLSDDLAAGRFDVVVLWEASRASRRLGEWAALLDACRDHGVRLHLVGDDRTYDPAKASDYSSLATSAVSATHETDRLSERAQRGVNRAVRGKRPPMGKVPHGYRRVYDGDTGDLVGQVPDEATAPAVRRMFELAEQGVPIATIARQLGWDRRLVRDRLRNPAYAGLRRHRRQGRNGDGRGTLHDGRWEALVSPSTFHAVQRVLDGHAHPSTSRTTYLLSGIARCGNGHELWARRRGRYYGCHDGCTQIVRDDLDDLVTGAVLAALASDALYARLRHEADASDLDAARARDEAAQLGARLDDYRARAAAGTVDPDDFAVIAATLREQIAAATARADRAALPPALRRFADARADVEARWSAAPLSARRDVIRALVNVEVASAGGRRGVPLDERVTITPA